jgi:hypothetical protein
MKFIILLLSFSCLFNAGIEAQEKRFFKINPGEKLVEKIPKDEMYTYPQFIVGTVYFRNNSYSVAAMNYNSLFAEMQFINPHGDTLSLDNENTISFIEIGTDTFYYDHGYLRLICNEGGKKLAEKTYFSFANRERLSGFGQSSSGEIQTYDAIATKSYLKELVAMEIITVVRNTALFIGDPFNNFKELNKKNLLANYGSKEKEVQAYLKENKVDLSNREELQKLMQHFKG